MYYSIQSNNMLLITLMALFIFRNLVLKMFSLRLKEETKLSTNQQNRVPISFFFLKKCVNVMKYSLNIDYSVQNSTILEFPRPIHNYLKCFNIPVTGGKVLMKFKHRTYKKSLKLVVA